MTGIVTASWISAILSGSAMRATPPSRLISAGTRSSAITEQAPASSAMSAWSASVTSMITPPFSISARPPLTRIVPSSAIASILAVQRAAENRVDGAKPDTGLVERGLTRRHALQGETREQERTGESRAGALDELPQLHRQRQRENSDRERRPERDGKGPHLVGGERDRSGEGGEVGTAAQREA